jgi:hypothetical protein
VTDADAARRWELANSAQSSAGLGILARATPGMDSLPPVDGSSSVFTCGLFIGSFLVTGCTKGCVRVHSLPTGQLVFVQRVSAKAIKRIEVRP